MGRILLVEDDRALNRGIRIALEKDKHDVDSVYDKQTAIAALSKEEYKLLLLDINLPDGSGIELCKEIRQKGKGLPVIFLTANDTEADMLNGFDAGCDDYVAKPFSVEVLRQKVLVLLRRVQGDIKEGNLFTYKRLKVDFDKMQVLLDGQNCYLTTTEYKLLEYLIKNKGRVLTRTMILENLWDVDGYFIDENTLSVHVKRLRQKIEENAKTPEYIVTVFGIGYTFGE